LLIPDEAQLRCSKLDCRLADWHGTLREDCRQLPNHELNQLLTIDGRHIASLDCPAVP
jgi:hypothetical protein